MSSNARHVTGSMLYDLTTCPRRVFLDTFGDAIQRDPPNAFVGLLWERGTLYEREVVAGLQQPFVDLSALRPDEREIATLEAMQRGEPLIYGGRIAANDMVGVPDLLRKEGAGYIPGDIKAGNGEEDAGDGDGKPKVRYAVQLALYADVLSAIGYGFDRRGFIWDIRGQEVAYDLTAPQGPKKPKTSWDEYLALLADARAILGGLEPRPASSSACKLCHWHDHCAAKLQDAGDLTLIPQLGRAIRDAMAVEIDSIAALAAANVEGFARPKNKTAFPGLGPDRLLKFQQRAILLSSPSAHPCLTAPVQLPAAQRELFFDIEVDPLRDHCYLHGIVERTAGDNATERFVSFFAGEPTPKSEEQAFADAFGFLTSDADARIYYYSKYERTIYRKLQERYPRVCTRDAVDALFDPNRAVDLFYDVVLPATEWPTHDYSIKTLAKYLGFGWRDTHPSGAASIEWFDRWVRSADDRVRQRILDYNEDDCRATRVLLDAIRALQ